MRYSKNIMFAIFLMLLLQCSHTLEEHPVAQFKLSEFSIINTSDLDILGIDTGIKEKILSRLNEFSSSQLLIRVNDREIRDVQSNPYATTLVSSDWLKSSAGHMMKHIWEDDFSAILHTEICIDSPGTTYQGISTSSIHYSALICFPVKVRLPLRIECYECPEFCKCIGIYEYQGEQHTVYFATSESSCIDTDIPPDVSYETEIPCGR